MKRVDYQDLLAEHGSSEYIPYEDFLRTWEWSRKKHAIEVRDGAMCHQCGNKESYYDHDSKKHCWAESYTREEVDVITGENITVWGIKKTFPDKPYILHCHHKYYVSETLPWDYPDEAFVTLCMHCHSEFHKTNKVPFYRKSDMAFLDYTPCLRCCGAGVLSEYSYHMGGVCFQCGGARYLELIK